MSSNYLGYLGSVGSHYGLEVKHVGQVTNFLFNKFDCKNLDFNVDSNDLEVCFETLKMIVQRLL